MNPKEETVDEALDAYREAMQAREDALKAAAKHVRDIHRPLVAEAKQRVWDAEVRAKQEFALFLLLTGRTDVR